jgi:hypothetical protein
MNHGLLSLGVYHLVKLRQEIIDQDQADRYGRSWSEEQLTITRSENYE